MYLDKQYKKNRQIVKDLNLKIENERILFWRFHFAPPAGDLEKELQWLTDVLEIPFW